MTPREHRLQAEELSRRHPVGTACRFWLGCREGEGRRGVIRCGFSVVCNTVVGWIEGVAGCVAATHIECEGQG